MTTDLQRIRHAWARGARVQYEHNGKTHQLLSPQKQWDPMRPEDGEYPISLHEDDAELEYGVLSSALLQHAGRHRNKPMNELAYLACRVAENLFLVSRRESVWNMDDHQIAMWDSLCAHAMADLGL